MIVTEIQSINNKKSRICTDEGISFVLYKGEIRRYGITEGSEIFPEDYREITEEVLLRRGKLRAMHLLQKMDRTEDQLRNKLREGEYPEEIIERVLEYVKGYHYVDDSRYVSNYLRSRGQVKSLRQMQAELYARGISTNQVQAVIEREGMVDEGAAIDRWIEKKHVEPDKMDAMQLQKFCQFLLRKGFKYEDIRSRLREYTSI